MPYPVSHLTVLPGNQSFLVLALPGATTGGIRLDHEGGTNPVEALASTYSSSASSWQRKIANKLTAGVEVTVGEDVSSIEAIIGLATYMDVYIKRSSAATTYDKIAGALVESFSKTISEDGQSHRRLAVRISGGDYTAGVAATAVPTFT